MSGGRRFDPSEVRVPGETDATQAELASLLAAARDLEALAASDGIRPTDGFEDRVMGAIATQPAPRVAVRSGSAVRGGPPAAFLLAVREAWGVALTGGRPMAMRAQALAFVLLVLVAVGSLAGAGAVTVGGLLSQHESPAPSVAPDQTISPTPSATPAPTPTMTDGPTSSTEATETPGPGETGVPGGTSDPGGPGETGRPGETARPTATPKAGQTPRPTQTPRATETPRPTDTPDPGDTPEPSDDHGGDGSGSGGPGPG
jgi:hypothetical protein